MNRPQHGAPIPRVTSAQGNILGRAIETPDGTVHVYTGVQFGVIDDRFARSSPTPRFAEPFDATRSGSIAFQTATREHPLARMSERDCLNLTLWNGAPGETDLPVLVWVHGGLHIAGSNAHTLERGDRLAAFGRMIVISVSYRLGAFGHLPLDHILGDDYRNASNLAVLDVIDALRWVRESVASFGGDPSNVTLAGQSAGGVVVGCVVTSPLATGLVTRAIVQSASLDRPAEADPSVTDELLRELGIEDRPDALLTAPARDVVAAQERVIAHRSQRRREPVAVFRPTTGTDILPLAPIEALKRGAAESIDLIVGCNANEATAFVDVTQADGEQLFAELRARLSARASTRADVADHLRRLSERRARSVSLAEALEAHLSDELYGNPTREFLRARWRTPSATFGYLFAWTNDDETWARRSGHSLELPFVFRHIDDSPEALASVGPNAPVALRDELSSHWISFATSGNPGGSWKQFGSRQTVARFG